MLSGYRLMWMFVMFDLPVVDRASSRAATRFRNFLLDQGFEMSQLSIYARFCNGKEQYETYLGRIEKNLPGGGEVHVIGFTVGYVVPKVLRYPESVARTVSIEVGMQNGGMAASLARVHFVSMPLAAAAGVFSGVIQNIIGGIAAAIWKRRPPSA